MYLTLNKLQKKLNSYSQALAWVSYAYNSDGFLEEKTTPEGITTYTYSTLGELKQVITPTKMIEYKHNANNQRVAKLVNGTIVEKYLWADLTTLLAVYDGNDNLLQRYEYADSRMPISYTQDSNKYYLHYDQVDSLRAISDNNHNIIKEIAYDSFGNILSDSNPSIKVPFGFAGGLYDEDTKLLRFGYRDYDSYSGKWTAKDPIDFDGDGFNLYGYVLNDPVNFVDLDGLAGLPWDKYAGGNGISLIVKYKIGKQKYQWYIDKNGNVSVPKSICEQGSIQVNRPQVQDLTSQELNRALKEARAKGNDAKRIESNTEFFWEAIRKFFGE